MLLRRISFPVHGAIELTIGFAIAAAPLALGLGPGFLVVGFALGAVLMGVALQAAVSDGPGVSRIAAHADFDRIVAIALLAIGAGAAITGQIAALAFFVVAGLAQLALIGSTRYSARV